MSCGPSESKFRLLDAYVGWSVDAGGAAFLDGLDDPAGLRLAAQDLDAAGPAIWRRLTPPGLARDCADCSWTLLTPHPHRLLRLQPCHPGWQAPWPSGCDHLPLVAPVALAGWEQRLAIADPGARGIWLWDRAGLTAPALMALPGVQAIAYSACGELLAVAGGKLHRYGRGGDLRDAPAPLGQLDGQVWIVAGDAAQVLWLVTRGAGRAPHLWRRAPGDAAFQRATLDELLAAPLPDTGLECVGEAGFQLRGQAGGWSWYGRPLASIAAPATPALQGDATLSTVALDSGMPRCRWHRVQLDADIPAGTSLRLQVASADDGQLAPHDGDWQSAPDCATDFLIDQPPGRYLFVRIVFHGDGAHTPVLRRVRLDFPRSTSLDSLPAVYRDNPRAEDFTERFLSLFDASIGALDDAIDQFPAALDVATARSELLPWLAGFLDLTFDPAWDPARQRAILAALPRLYRLRGTVAGMRLAIRLVFDADVVLQELAGERAWNALGGEGVQDGAVLGAVRLFGKARARLALGRSALGRAPLKSYGDPDRDPLASGAYRFRVLVPPGPLVAGPAMRRLERLVQSQKPAHTQATVRAGGAGFILGTAIVAGIDSLLGPLPAPLLGAAGNVKLGRMSVLWPARRRRHSVFVLGSPVVAGVQTVLE